MGEGSSKAQETSGDHRFAAEYLAKVASAHELADELSPQRQEDGHRQLQLVAMCCGKGGSEEILVSPSTQRVDPDMLTAGENGGCREVCSVQQGPVERCCVCWSGDDHDIAEGPEGLDVILRRADGEVLVDAPDTRARALQVPGDFQSNTSDWANPKSHIYAPSPAQTQKLRLAMGQFARSMSGGGIMARLRLDDEFKVGATLDVVAGLSGDLSTLLVARSGSVRRVPLRSVRWVRPPDVKGQSAEKCAMLRMAGGRVLCFEFESPTQAAFFGMCMRLLVKAARSEH